MYPETRTELYQEYKALRKRGLKVKGFWFKTRAKQLLEWIDPETLFSFSDGWFARSNITSVSTNVFQKPADDKKSAVRSSARSLVTVNRRERWDGLDSTRSRMLIRRLSSSVLLTDQHMQTLETAQFGSEELDQALRRDSVQYNLHCLQMGRLE